MREGHPGPGVGSGDGPHQRCSTPEAPKERTVGQAGGPQAESQGALCASSTSRGPSGPPCSSRKRSRSPWSSLPPVPLDLSDTVAWIFACQRSQPCPCAHPFLWEFRLQLQGAN